MFVSAAATCVPRWREAGSRVCPDRVPLVRGTPSHFGGAPNHFRGTPNASRECGKRLGRSGRLQPSRWEGGERHLPDIEQWCRVMAPTSSRGGLVLA